MHRRAKGGKQQKQKSKQGDSKNNDSWKLKLPLRNVTNLDHLEKCNSNLLHCNEHLPIISKWIKNKGDLLTKSLDTGYSLLSYRESINPVNNEIDKFITVKDSVTGDISEKNIYMKTIHILEPYRWMKHGEISTQTPSADYWTIPNETVNDPETMAYTDGLASVLMNQLYNGKKTPHVVRCFGVHRAISKKYIIHLEDDFESYRFTRWFWENQKKGLFKIIIKDKETNTILTDVQIINMFKPDEDHLTDTEDSDDESDDESDSDSGSGSDDDSGSGSDGGSGNDDDSSSIGSEIDDTMCTKNHTVNIDDCELKSVTSIRTTSDDIIHIDSRNKRQSRQRKNHTDSTFNSDESSDSLTDRYDFICEFSMMPVVVIYLEKMSNALDILLDEHTLINIQPGTDIWTLTWTAWLFQICAVLAQVQAACSLTHNDLHTNNILWKNTTEEFLYYSANVNGIKKTWKIPTYGKIFQIIDFGRAIYTVENQVIISSDHRDGRDAGGQYNFGSIEDKDIPRVYPNKSFDLSRLACSLLHGLFPLYPIEKVGGKILTKEGSWIVNESVNPLFNLIWTWLRDDDGECILEDKLGEEKYPGFELYSIIASSVHNAIPSEQLLNPIFTGFLYSGIIPENTIPLPNL